eukprot:m.57481 g.57481  ORF g.57481 m.57481 type:complete len:459 (+) comp11234_c0_seq1:2458-3834(+)
MMMCQFFSSSLLLLLLAVVVVSYAHLLLFLSSSHNGSDLQTLPYFVVIFPNLSVMPWKPPPQPKCARCEKTVYPTEQLKCLDKLWHKPCFNCEVCHVKLTMNTYRGYDKKPYCKTHYPTSKATQVADTPETLRLKKQTERQSAVKYHQAFESEKGKMIGSATDRSMETSKNAAKLASGTAYRQNLPPPTQTSNVAATKQPIVPTSTPATTTAPPPTTSSSSSSEQWVAEFDYEAADADEVSLQEGDVIVEYESVDEGWAKGRNSRTGASGMFPSNYVVKKERSQAPPAQPEPVPEPEPEPEPVPEPEPEVVVPEPEPEPEPEPVQESAPTDGKKWIAQYDYDATDNDEVSFKEGDVITNVTVVDEGWVTGTVQSTGQSGMLPSNYVQEEGAETPQATAEGGETWVAQFDYDATDSDEVSFKEGDIIINVTVVDEGWVTGTVESTGQSGMLPSNYIDKQ